MAADGLSVLYKMANLCTTRFCRKRSILPISVASRSQGVVLRPLRGWDCGFELCRTHECLSPVSVVCFQVEVSVTGRSLIQTKSYRVCMCYWVWSGKTLTHYAYTEYVEWIRVRKKEVSILKQGRKCTYNVSLWYFRLMFIPPNSLIWFHSDECVFKAMSCRQQQ